MGVDSIKIREMLTNQLTDLDDSLGATVEDVNMLADIQKGIGEMIDADDKAETEIRKVLKERYDDGALRAETFQLVTTILDNFVSEDIPTSPLIKAAKKSRVSKPKSLDDIPEPRPDKYSSTTVLPNDQPKQPTAEDCVQVGSLLRERFLLQQRVSGGSMGVVYKALDRRLAEAGNASPWVAIKVLSPQLSKSGSALRALQQEAAKGRCLTHPNIVRFVDLDRDDELYFIVMEWLEGRTLADILDRSEVNNVDVKEALRIVWQIGSALDYAHRCGIIHADVKPGNIMISPDGDARLFDFGVARVRQSSESDSDFDPGVLGALTPAYSSMQVLTGEEPVPADDVFSLGCLFYRLVAGYRVFGPRNAAQAAEEGMKPQQPNELSDVQWAAVKKAISFSRVTRFDSAADFLAALQGSESVADAGFEEEREPTTGPIHSDKQLRLAPKPEKKSHVGLYFLALLLSGALFAEYRFGAYDKARAWMEQRMWRDEIIVIEEPVEDLEMVPLDTTAMPSELDENIIELDTITDQPMPETPIPVPVVDFSTLPAADVEVSLVESGTDAAPVAVYLREDAGPVVVDLFRTGGLKLPLRLRIEEVSYSGNRSPWASSQYFISEEGILDIPTGQDRARITLEMASDPLREADQTSTLRIRDADYTDIQLASIEAVLEDDDQRSFEAELPPNAFGFAVSQVAVSERDPAVQIDILRFNPDDRSLTVNYSVRDVTAAQGEDYFAPTGSSVTFGPGQRSARLLIPLVQDTVNEGDEAFRVELALVDQPVGIDVYQNIIVMIRDDDFGR